MPLDVQATEQAMRGVLAEHFNGGDEKGCVAAVAYADGDPVIVAHGTDDAGTTFSANTRFPVASITKMATALAVLRLIDGGQAGLDQPLSDVLGDVPAAQSGVTLRRLLSHTSGFQEPLVWEPHHTWQDLEQSWLATTPADPGGHFEYSNLGYCILGAVVQALAGERWTAALTNLVLRALQVQASIGEPVPAGLPTLGGNPNFGHFRRLEWLALGLPDSGLVSTVSATLSLVKAFAGYAPEWPLALVQEATSVQTAELPAAGYARPPWGLGVQIRGDQNLHPVETWTPRGASAASFGHQGASGGLVWHDPQSHVSLAFFTSHDASRPNWQFAGRYLLGGRLLACAKMKEH